jgi:hypothetical protein
MMPATVHDEPIISSDRPTLFRKPGATCNEPPRIGRGVLGQPEGCLGTSHRTVQQRGDVTFREHLTVAMCDSAEEMLVSRRGLSRGLLVEAAQTNVKPAAILTDG